MTQLDKWNKELQALSNRRYKQMDGELYNYYKSALKELKIEIKDYLERYEELSFSKRLELENQFKRAGKIDEILTDLSNKTTPAVKEYVREELQNGYYGTWYALEGAENIQLDFGMLPEKYIEELVNKPVAGKRFSTRLYNNRNALAERVTTSLLNGATSGKGYAKIAKEIGELTEANYKQSLRIARTEGGRVQSITKQRSYEEAKKKGVDIQKRWMATLDKKTRTQHQILDGQTVDIEDKFKFEGKEADGPRLFGDAGLDINCRCTTIIVVNGISPEVRRDNEMGEIVKYKNYQEWEKERIGEQERKASSSEYGANLPYVRSNAYRDKIAADSQIGHIADEIVSVTRRMLQHRDGTPFEDYYLLDKNTGKIAAVSNKARITKGVVYNKQVLDAYRAGGPNSYISIHNHPSGFPPSLSDIATLSKKNKNDTVGLGVVVGHDGSIYWYTKANKMFRKSDILLYDKLVVQHVKLGYNEVRAQEIALSELSKIYEFIFRKVDD